MKELGESVPAPARGGGTQVPPPPSLVSISLPPFLSHSVYYYSFLKIATPVDPANPWGVPPEAVPVIPYPLILPSKRPALLVHSLILSSPLVAAAPWMPVPVVSTPDKPVPFSIPQAHPAPPTSQGKWGSFPLPRPLIC